MLNKQSKMLRLSALSLAVAGAMAIAPTTASAEVSASVGIANMYLWRGNDLGAGDAAVSGDLSYSESGFYTGVWASSGDASLGSEYDLYVGYGAEFAGVSVDLSVWTYTYANAADTNDPGELSDAVLSLGFAGFSLTAYDNIAGGDGSSGSAYYTLGYGYDAYSIMVGKHDLNGVESDNMVHVDLGYAYNDNLSFVVSQQIDNENDNGKPKVVVSYSLPIEM
jgi:uncharacterized protein (TIGR02001 family)